MHWRYSTGEKAGLKWRPHSRIDPTCVLGRACFCECLLLPLEADTEEAQTLRRPRQASARSSVWYFGAMAFALSRNSAICYPSRAGGGVVRVATGTPTSRK